MKRAILIAAVPVSAAVGVVAFGATMAHYFRNAPEIAARIADDTIAHIDAMIEAERAS